MAPWCLSCCFGLLLASLIAGCVISPRRLPGDVAPGATPTPTPGTATGKLYVSNQAANSILRFDGASTASANVAPGATIAGGATQLSSPQYLFVDQAADRLFVANTGGSSVLIFDAVSTMTGNNNTAPTRSIFGAATTLNSPSDLALDKGRDMLYVADNLNILVFNAASSSTTTGNVPVARNLSVGFSISAIFLDAANDRLFLSDAVGSAVHVYDNVSTLTSGAVAANRTIMGVGTQLASPVGLQVDGAGRLIVSNNAVAATGITMYSNAATASGNATPVAAISGSNTGFGSPSQIALDATGSGTLYITDPGTAKIPIYSSLSSTNGNLTPTRNINGAATTLGQNTGIALDTTH